MTQSPKQPLTSDPSIDRHARHGLKNLQRHISNALDDMYERIGRHHHGVSGHVAENPYPESELSEAGSGFEFIIDLPGFDESDLEISVSGGYLKISGTRTAESDVAGKNYLVQERRYGRFERAFWLSDNLDTNQAEAILTNGVLRVTVPWAKGKSQPAKRIPINKKKT
jgi:HSP20 family protein